MQRSHVHVAVSVGGDQFKNRSGTKVSVNHLFAAPQKDILKFAAPQKDTFKFAAPQTQKINYCGTSKITHCVIFAIWVDTRF
jgi:hypothetical protein